MDCTIYQCQTQIAYGSENYFGCDATEQISRTVENLSSEF